jgi:hypothetical protein
MAWRHISMDFVEGLTKSNGKEVILVVVDRLTKYAHFIPLSHPYTVYSVVQDFLDNVFKLHGMLMSTHASILVDGVGPPSADVCRAAASFP